VVWAVYSPIAIYKSNPHLFLLAVGLVYANFVGRIVVARVVKQDFHPIQWVLWPLPVGALIAYFPSLRIPYFEERQFLYLFFVWSVAMYLHFALSIISAMTEYLKINCLTLTDAQIARIPTLLAQAANRAPAVPLVVPEAHPNSHTAGTGAAGPTATTVNKVAKRRQNTNAD